MSETVTRYESFVPDAVRKASERADELRKQSLGEVANPDGSEKPKPDAGTVEQPLTPEAQPPAQDGHTVQQQPGESAEEWRQRFNTLQGKYNREVPELNSQLRNLTNQINQMQEQMRAAPPPPPAPAPSPTHNIPKEDLDAYGPELVEASRRWARAEVQRELAEMKAQLGEVAESTKHVKTRSAQTGVENYMDANMSDWRQINNQPEFLQWLQQQDVFSKRVRHGMLTEAFNRGDAETTAAFFKAFKTEHTAVATPQRQPAHTPNGAGQLDLTSMAAPGRAPAQGSNGAPREAKIWSRPEIAAFYTDVRRGAYRGREPEQARIESDIHKASTEGRVR